MSVHSDRHAEPGAGSGLEGAPAVPQAPDVAPHTPAHDRGASAMEYALLIGLIALVIFAALALLGLNVSEIYSSITTGY